MCKLHGIVAVALLGPLVACTQPEPGSESGSDSETGETGETGDDAPDYAVELRERTCEFEIPSGRSASCHTLVVPLDRSEPERGVVELPVAVLHPIGAASRAPVVYFHGGPGGRVYANAPLWFERAASHDGELVLFDQRGAGAALPSLDCPELVAGWYEVFATVGAPQDELALLEDAYAQCHARLSAELDLDSFNTPTSADDAEDLRRALGYESWSVYGISYGTRLGLELMRRHGEHVERAVLDSVYPPQLGGVDWMVDNSRDALDRMIAGCLAEQGCGATFANLAADLEAAVALLDAQPYELTVVDDEGLTHELALTGADLYAGMYNALYDVELIPLVPLLIFQAAQGNFAFLDQLAEQSIPGLTGVAEGARLSVDCIDGGALIDGDALAQAVASEPALTTLFGAYAPPFCALWGVAPGPAEFLDPVVSEIPTLLLAGEFDPVTPVRDTELAGAGLSAAQLYVFPGFGHGPSTQSACAQGLAAGFLRDGVVDDGCWAAIGPNTF